MVGLSRRYCCSATCWSLTEIVAAAAGDTPGTTGRIGIGRRTTGGVPGSETWDEGWLLGDGRVVARVWEGGEWDEGGVMGVEMDGEEDMAKEGRKKKRIFLFLFLKKKMEKNGEKVKADVENVKRR